MIRKLRVKLVMASMLALTIVLAVVVSGINLINYLGILRDADSVLALLKENNGRFSQERNREEWRRTGSRFRSPELAFESRFFSVVLDEAGQALSTDRTQIAAVDEQEAAQYAKQAFATGAEHGFIGDYRFVVGPAEEGVRVIFLDCGRKLSGFASVLVISLGISLVMLIAVFLLIVLLSGRIVRPFSRSFEKQKQFVTDAGHEIKTPITIIDADAEVLGMEIGANEWLDDIRLQTKRLATLTHDLIRLSRMEEIREAQGIDFPLSDLVVETAASFQALAVTHHKRFTMDVQPMLSFHGDEKAIAQLLTILLDNAIKYSNAGGSISLCLRQRGKTMALTVTNSVDAISQETLRSMFDRFYRGDSSRSSAIQGYGIGLSLAKAIVDAHKGKIHAQSENGKAVKITVLLSSERTSLVRRPDRRRPASP